MITTKENADRLVSIADEMADLLDEFKHICRSTMSSNQYEQFKYRTLGHLEPGLLEESEWFTRYSGVDSLQKVAALVMEEAEDEEDEDEGVELPK